MHKTVEMIFKPQGATRVVDKTSGAYAFLWERDGKPYARTFFAKSQKPVASHYFQTAARRDQYVAGFFEGAREHKARVTASRAERQKPHDLKVGDLLYTSWGYEQTNCEFYEVTRVVGARTVEVRQIEQTSEETGWCQGTTTPKPGRFKGETLRRQVNNGSVKIHESARAYKWDGTPRGWSSYH